MLDSENIAIRNYKKLTRYFLEREIINYYGFLKTLDDNLTNKHVELTKKTDIAVNNRKQVNSITESKKEIVELQVESEQVKGFINLLRQSFLTSLFSFMELWLLRECHLDSKRRGGEQIYNSVKGKGIEKAKRYFIYVANNQYPFGTSQDWFWIKKFQLLRDCIIHRLGSLTGLSDFVIEPSLEKFVKDEHGLSLYGVINNQIFIEFEFCEKALTIIHRFMIKVLVLDIE
jgi:hypothetical protein